MWAFLSARLRTWLIFAVVAPLIGWLLGKIGDLIESRTGANALTKALKLGRDWLRGRTRGPLSTRRPAPIADASTTGNPAR